ncbi:hypothetical protein BHE74_00029971 [Ensete ventricosum]|nr:hypothetical protein BHE74_00029971 [Ensete ventricosum]
MCIQLRITSSTMQVPYKQGLTYRSVPVCQHFVGTGVGGDNTRVTRGQRQRVGNDERATCGRRRRAGDLQVAMVEKSTVSGRLRKKRKEEEEEKKKKHKKRRRRSTSRRPSCPSAVATRGFRPRVLFSPCGETKRLPTRERIRGDRLDGVSVRADRDPGGYHEYIDVIARGNACSIVDINIVIEFEIAKPTTDYMTLLRVLSVVFIGS